MFAPLGLLHQKQATNLREIISRNPIGSFIIDFLKKVLDDTLGRYLFY